MAASTNVYYLDKNFKNKSQLEIKNLLSSYSMDLTKQLREINTELEKIHLSFYTLMNLRIFRKYITLHMRRNILMKHLEEICELSIICSELKNNL